MDLDDIARGSTLLGLLVSANVAVAQGTMTFNTGGGQPLISAVRALTVDPALVEPRLLFDFGFATEESLATGTLLDSFTVSIQDSNRVFTAVYVTVDASGDVLAPITPGTLPIDPQSIITAVTAYPSLEPVLPNQRAFQVSAPIPSQFAGMQVDVFFDLFDNLNTQASQAWFDNLQIISVPEPQPWAMLLLAGALRWSFSRCRK